MCGAVQCTAFTTHKAYDVRTIFRCCSGRLCCCCYCWLPSAADLLLLAHACSVQVEEFDSLSLSLFLMLLHAMLVYNILFRYFARSFARACDTHSTCHISIPPIYIYIYCRTARAKRIAHQNGTHIRTYTSEPNNTHSRTYIHRTCILRDGPECSHNT